MILFFDTETTGFPDFNARARDPKQPHIVQLAAMLCLHTGGEYESHNVIVKPDGWEIPAEASNVHGITEAHAAHGVAEKTAAEMLISMIRRASLIVAHNLQFDKFIARIAMRRHELITDGDDQWWKDLPTFCTMRNMTDVCKLPSTRVGQFKWPKLQEAHMHAFGKPFDGAHDALADVRACRDVYFWLKNRKPTAPRMEWQQEEVA